jgi:hypothetical protein
MRQLYVRLVVQPGNHAGSQQDAGLCEIRERDRTSPWQRRPGQQLTGSRDLVRTPSPPDGCRSRGDDPPLRSLLAPRHGGQDRELVGSRSALLRRGSLR